MKIIRKNISLFLSVLLLCGTFSTSAILEEANPSIYEAYAEQGKELPSDITESADTKKTEEVQELPVTLTSASMEGISPAEEPTSSENPSPTENLENTEDDPEIEEVPGIEETPTEGPSQAVTPEATEESSAAEEPSTTQEIAEPIDDDLENDEEEELILGDIMLGDYASISAAPGESLTLAIPIMYKCGESSKYSSNTNADGTVRPYHSGHKDSDYDQTIAEVLEFVSVTIKESQDEDFALADILGEGRTLISNGKNTGYAVFEDVYVLEAAKVGICPVRLEVRWRDIGGDEQKKILTVYVSITEGDVETDAEAEVETDSQTDVEADEQADVVADAEAVLAADMMADAIAGELDDVESEDVALGEYEIPTAEVGGVMTMAIPIQYTRESQVYKTNEGSDGGRVTFDDDASVTFSQAVTEFVSEMRVTIADGQSENFPFETSALSQSRAVISGGQNLGYAVFENLQVLSTAVPGEYPLLLKVSWTETGSGQQLTKTLTATAIIYAPAEVGSDETNYTVETRVELGACETLKVPLASPATATDGSELITLAIPINYFVSLKATDETQNPPTIIQAAEDRYDTNSSNNEPGQDKNIIPYGGGGFDQSSITGVLSMATVAIADAQDAACPLDLSSWQGTVSEPLIRDGMNYGYAAFADIPLLPGLVEGAYPVKFTVTWQSVGGMVQSTPLTVYVYVGTPSAPMLYGENGIIVFTHAQLRSALQNTVPGYTGRAFDPIYLGYCDDTTMTDTSKWERYNAGEIRYPVSGGIAISRSLTIIGTDPRNKKRVAVYDSGSSGTTCLHTDRTNLSITLRDVEFYGVNLWGMVFTANSGCSISYINVKYYGRQAAYSSVSNTVFSFTNCDFEITNYGGVAEEVFQGAEVRLYGRIKIYRHNSGSIDAVFWLQVSPYKLYIAPGANVDVDTNDYLIYRDGAASASASVDGRLNVTARANGCFTYTGQRLINLTIGKSGELILRQANTSGSYYAIMATNLTVYGVLDVERITSSSSLELVSVTGTSNFHSPKFVRLRNNHTGALLTGTANINNISALNRWTKAGSTRYVWNNRGLDDETFSVRVSGTTITPTGLVNGNRGIAVGAQVLNGTNFTVTNTSNMVIFGSYSGLTIDDIYDRTRTITGVAPAGSSLTVTEQTSSDNYVANFSQRQAASTLTMSGSKYNAKLTSRVLDQSRVYVECTQSNGLTAFNYANRFTTPVYTAPDLIDFGTVSISTRSQLINPVSIDGTLEVLDMRDGGDWELQASATAFLNGSEPLDGELVFIDPDTNFESSMTSSVRIASKPEDAVPGEATIINWEENTGLLVRLNPLAGERDASYSATITWTFVVTPIDSD